jgi:hypothetical protein
MSKLTSPSNGSSAASSQKLCRWTSSMRLLISAKTQLSELGIAQGIAQGKEAGLMEGKLETARNMLRDSVPFETVCKYTALSKETIERLRAEL